MADLSVRIGDLALRSPVMPASGCFAAEYSEAIDFKSLGALVIKSVSPTCRAGNPTPRVAETASGMLNSIGIPSRGMSYYLESVLPAYLGYGTPVVVSISADTVLDFAEAVEAVSLPEVAAVEANISCPNLEEDGMAFAMSPESSHRVIREIKRRTSLPVWAKLTPNASNVASVAKACEEAGADALVMGNTVLGMSIDVRTRKPKLGNVMGGLSGPAIKPIALRMVHQCYRSVRIPVIGCGGISTGEDAVEFMLAGATAVQVGTASFINPAAMQAITTELRDYCDSNGIAHARDLTGGIRIDRQLSDRWLRFAQQSG